MLILTSVQIMFYRVNDYFVLSGVHLAEDCSTKIFAKLPTYGVKTNHHSVRVFSCEYRLIKVTTVSSNVDPKKSRQI